MAPRDWTGVDTHVEIHVLMMNGWSPYIQSKMWGKPGQTPQAMTRDQVVILEWVQEIREGKMIEVGPAQKGRECP